jgi:hypothetical protein
MHTLTSIAFKIRPAAGIYMVWLVQFILLHGCARVGAPTGGIKDTTPPSYLKGTPGNRSTHFSAKEIELEFDEYLQLKDLNKELMISPPLEKKPDIRLKGKSIRINLENKLLPNTTYTFNFGNAIVDNNEGNPLPDFEYVFSTGDNIDSLAVTGKVLDAFSHKPADEAEVMMIMLYDNLADSAPLKEIPRYVGRANRNGLFSINNIKTDTFRVVALNDANNNMRYDPFNESIAFLDSFIYVSPETVIPTRFIKDTVKLQPPERKTGKPEKGTLMKGMADTAIVQGKALNALNVSLFYFKEESDKVFITSRKRESRDMLLFTFSRPTHDSVVLSPVNFTPGREWLLKEPSLNRDTLTCWIIDSLVARKDTLLITISYTTTDSLNNFIVRTDTVNLRYTMPVERSPAGRKTRISASAKPDKFLKLTANVADKGKAGLDVPLVFVAERPLQQIAGDSIELFRMQDSLVIKQDFTCMKDSGKARVFKILVPWEEDTKYRLLLKPGTATDFMGKTNDSLSISFSTQKADYYGRLLVSIDAADFPLIVQLLNEKEKMVAKRYLEKPDRVIFDYLVPGRYILKAIHDRNKNQKWDTGRYLEQVQPEAVFFYKMNDDLRANWDLELIWHISD